MSIDPAGTVVLGVVGGMGPLASAEFVRRLYAHACLSHCKEQYLPRVIVTHDPSAPNRTQALLGEDPRPRAVVARFIERQCSWLLQSGATDLLICCMTAHCWVDALPPVIRERVFDLRHVVVTHVDRAPSVKRWFVASSLGSVRTGLLERALSSEKYKLALPGDGLARTIHDTFYSLKTGADPTAAGERIASAARHAGCDGLLVCCTEGVIIPWQAVAHDLFVVEPLNLIASLWPLSVGRAIRWSET